MARSELDLDDEPLESLAQLKEKVHGLNEAQLKGLLFTLMDEFDSVNIENCMLKDVCSNLRKDIRKLEHANEVLKSEKHDVDKKNLVLEEGLNKLKKTLNMREEVLDTNLSKLEKMSLLS